MKEQSKKIIRELFMKEKMNIRGMGGDFDNGEVIDPDNPPLK